MSDGSVETGTCSTFKSLSSTPIIEEKWYFIGFTYSTYFKTGTFVINQVYGFEDSENKENNFFDYDTKFWLGVNTQGFGISFRLGGKTNDFGSDIESFSGKMSCLQIYDISLQPSQIFHLSTCPLPRDHNIARQCPEGSTFFRNFCYKVSSKEETFSKSEYSCIDNKGDILILSFIITEIKYICSYCKKNIDASWNANPLFNA